jgi:hypothetical protein
MTSVSITTGFAGARGARPGVASPDSILTDFLERGASGLPDDHKNVVTDQSRFYDALSELAERFSLIGRQSDHIGGERITIHRLVQCVVKDDMTSPITSCFAEAVIGLCERAFPAIDGNKPNSIEVAWRRRLAQTQMVMPLLSLRHSGDSTSIKMGMVLFRVGSFLTDDEKFGPRTWIACMVN